MKIDPNWSNYVNMFPISFVCPSLTLYASRKPAAFEIPLRSNDQKEHSNIPSSADIRVSE